jgi:FkbM family methyltransferase
LAIVLENIIPRLLGWVPISWRQALIGQPDNPSRVATLAHNLLNLVPPGESQVYDCQGALAGYRMSIDWNRFRSFVYGTWEPEVTKVVATTVKPGMTVVDIGAHIGYYTLLFAKYVGPSGRVFAFEPLPANFELLERNVRLNELPYIQTFSQAIFSRNQEVALGVPDDLQHSGDASVYHGGGARQFRVSATTLDSFCDSANLRPDVVKMDVEGAEYDVLMGAERMIDRFRPKLLIELHHFDGNLAAHPVPDLLSSWGCRIRWIERSKMTSHILATPVESAAAGSEAV